MDYLLYFSFVLAAITFIIIPGPNIMVIVSTSMTHGTRRGLQTVLGTSSAMLVQLLIAAAGTAWFVDAMTQGLRWLRWLGVIYLLYLGIMHFQKLVAGREQSTNAISLSSTYLRGFVVSLTNPKTILFFAAFFPQFISEHYPYTTQILILSLTFLLLATIIDALFALLAEKIKNYTPNRNLHTLQHSLSGSLLIGAGAWLGLMRKS